MFGCDEYGRMACCPPNVPPINECREFFSDYKDAVIFHFEKTVDKPEDRYEWTTKINQELIKLEREVFVLGYQKAFLLFMDSCCLCTECSPKREGCKFPELSRPGPESMGIDVFTTVRKYGFPIKVLSDYTKKMNRYAFLLIE